MTDYQNALITISVLSCLVTINHFDFDFVGIRCISVKRIELKQMLNFISKFRSKFPKIFLNYD